MHLLFVAFVFTLGDCFQITRRHRADVLGRRKLKFHVKETTASVDETLSPISDIRHNVTTQEWLVDSVFLGIEPSANLWAILTVYFVQGSLGITSLATYYFLKDELHLSPAESTALLGVTSLPWVLKPVRRLSMRVSQALDFFNRMVASSSTASCQIPFHCSGIDERATLHWLVSLAAHRGTY
jgi:hypothetical protein